MTDRKTYSRRREEALWRCVDKAITDFRIYILRGGLESYSPKTQEQAAIKFLDWLPDRVANEHRRVLNEPKAKE